MDKTSLGDRMKSYEKVTTNIKLMPRTPVVIRLDGKAFHTYTKRCYKPYDKDLSEVREQTLKYLCENIQGVIFGYSQPDELSLVLKDWDTYDTQGWFDNKLQKLCSVSSSICTYAFNLLAAGLDGERTKGPDKFTMPALFDSRVFNLPKEEVVNYLIWRQQDCERKSFQMLAQNLYPHKELQNLSHPQLLTKIAQEKGIIWGNMPNKQKRGEFWVKGLGLVDTPIFKSYRDTLELELYNQGE